MAAHQSPLLLRPGVFNDRAVVPAKQQGCLTTLQSIVQRISPGQYHRANRGKRNSQLRPWGRTFARPSPGWERVTPVEAASGRLRSSPGFGKYCADGICTWTISFLTAYNTNSAME